MMFDPKAIMVAAAFLASKIEDATVNVHDLVKGTEEMQALVSAPDIIVAELHLLCGVDKDLMCHHPYKTVLAYTEDLRTYLKSERGRKAVMSTSVPGESSSRTPVIVSGEDLRPMHDNARLIVEDICVSDVPLMYTPGQIGLAAMLVANEDLKKKRDENAEKEKAEASTSYVKIDLSSYVKYRFEGRSEKEHALLKIQMNELMAMLGELKDGKYGCGNHGIDMGALKVVHKKLKKCRRWGDNSGKDENKKKKKKKRKAESG
mmetsp:Transcript_24600/g.28342  ORF Transcript_24600/g.28342 Transcript_24600/m.28342 type:complete len:261 (+) Transcript_24600:392-1174(+)